MAVGSSDNAYVTGNTLSTNFPTQNPYQANNGGDYDAFVSKLSATGDSLIFSTYVGGSGSDTALELALDPSGNAYVAGGSLSSNFPTMNPYQASNHGEYDVFVFKIDVSGYIYFAELTVGGGWKTVFALYCTGSTPTSGELFIIGQDGNPLIVDSSSMGTGSSFPISILPGGAMFLTLDMPSPGDPGQSGWAIAEFEGSLSGVATYQFQSGGLVTAMAGVLPSQPMQFATVPVNDDLNLFPTTAYAIANPTDQNVLIKICYADTDGNVVDDTVSVPLGPGEQIARYFYQDLGHLGLTQFTGSMVLRAQGNGSFIAVALIQNQDLFTVTPVEARKAPNIPD